MKERDAPPEIGVAAPELRIDASQLPMVDRLEAVRDAICQHVVRVEIDLPPAPLFDARCRVRALGAFMQCSVQSNARTVRRTPRLAKDDMEPTLFLGLQVSGTSMVIQDGREAVLRPGDMALYDTTRPYTLVNDGGIDHHYFGIPRAQLALPGRTISSAMAVRLRPHEPVAGLVSAFFTRLANEQVLPVGAWSAIGIPSVELVRALIATRASVELAREPMARTLVERSLEYARIHLGDPGLTPSSIAAAQHVSVRRLYAAMADAQVSLAGWIRTQRLEACRLELGRRTHHLPVAAVAARWGFVDPAHFSRVFRAEFGLSPREWRQRTLGPPAR